MYKYSKFQLVCIAKLCKKYEIMQIGLIYVETGTHLIRQLIYVSN